MAKKNERYILQTNSSKLEGYEQAGTLAEWRDQVGTRIAGNHRLVMAVSVSFAAPLLHHLDQQGFGVNFRGSSSVGKTTALRAAKSVMGDHAHIRTWRATSSALESIAAMHNDNTLFLDEMGEADPKEIGATAYMLANGQGKARQTRTIELRPALKWRMIYLSTGELSLADMLAQVRQKMKAGQAVRVIDLPADAEQGFGIFDTIPDDFTDGEEFADYLKDTTKQQHGTAFIAYMDSLVSSLSDHIQTVRDFRAEWKKTYIPKGADSQVKRVADSFATIAAGGELATDLGVTGWQAGDAAEAAAVCFAAWLQQRGGLGNQEQADILKFIKNHFEADGAAKYAYINIRPQDDKVMYRMGYRDDDGNFFVLPERFKTELCEQAGFDKKLVLDVLKDNGYLVCGADGKPTITKRVYSLDVEHSADSKQTKRVHHIAASIVGGE